VPDPQLGFAVTVGNPGIVGEKDVDVTLTVGRTVLSRRVDRLDAGGTATLLFRRAHWGSGVTAMVVEARAARGTRALAAFPVAFGPAYRPPSVGPHGTGLQAVKALPGNSPLSPARLNRIVSVAPAFAVRVKDTGASPETRVKVTLTVLQSPNPVVVTRTIPYIETGRQKLVVFRRLGPVVYSTRSRLRIDVRPVPGEKNLANNSATYSVVFTLG
jgi:hypothetical protein